jgi:hypothetical protein
MFTRRIVSMAAGFTLFTICAAGPSQQDPTPTIPPQAPMPGGPRPGPTPGQPQSPKPPGPPQGPLPGRPPRGPMPNFPSPGPRPPRFPRPVYPAHPIWRLYPIFPIRGPLEYFSRQNQQVVLIGSATVTGLRDYSVIYVGAGESYRSVQFYVSGGSLDIRSMSVRYGDGTEEQITMGGIVPAGALTPPITLSGNRAGIVDIGFSYANTSWRTSPTVTLYGLW